MHDLFGYSGFKKQENNFSKTPNRLPQTLNNYRSTQTTVHRSHYYMVLIQKPHTIDSSDPGNNFRISSIIVILKISANLGIMKPRTLSICPEQRAKIETLARSGVLVLPLIGSLCKLSVGTESDD